MFCPHCNSLMFPSGGKEFVCKKCGYKESPKGKFQSFKEKSKDREMMVLEDDLTVLPRTKIECPKCKHNEAFWVLRQTRAADEPETRIYQCVKCKHKWREYQ